jgi:hypothetical protein
LTIFCTEQNLTQIVNIYVVIHTAYLHDYKVRVYSLHLKICISRLEIPGARTVRAREDCSHSLYFNVVSPID